MNELIKIFVADSKIIDLHQRVLVFSVDVNEKIHQVRKDNNPHPHPMASAALHTLTGEVVALHQAVLSLCENGWAFPASILIRTILDLFVNVLVITKANGEAEYMAFRCLFSYLKEEIADPTTTDEVRRNIKKKIEDNIKVLPENYRKPAKDFIYSEKVGGYWFKNKFSDAKDVLKIHDSEMRVDLYDMLSMASHGGVIGTRLFKDKPNEVSPNPRADREAQNKAILLSNRLTLDVFGIRGKYEDCGIEEEYIEIHNAFDETRELVDT